MSQAGDAGAVGPTAGEQTAQPVGAGDAGGPSRAGEITNPATQRRQFFFTWNAPEGNNTLAWCEGASVILKNAMD